MFELIYVTVYLILAGTDFNQFIITINSNENLSSTKRLSYILAYIILTILGGMLLVLYPLQYFIIGLVMSSFFLSIISCLDFFSKLSLDTFYLQLRFVIFNFLYWPPGLLGPFLASSYFEEPKEK